jgi:hypothetical protein
MPAPVSLSRRGFSPLPDATVNSPLSLFQHGCSLLPDATANSRLDCLGFSRSGLSPCGRRGISCRSEYYLRPDLLLVRLAVRILSLCGLGLNISALATSDCLAVLLVLALGADSFLVSRYNLAYGCSYGGDAWVSLSQIYVF